MIRVRAANPGPAALWVVNPQRRRRNNMRTKRRRGRRRTARRNPLLLNPTRRRRTTRRRTHVHARRRSNGIFSFLKPRRRRRNPRFVTATRRQRRRYLRRRRIGNPGGLLAKGFALATAAAGLQFVLMWVPPLGGVSAVADAARTAGLGWLAGLAMRKTGILASYADDVTLAGFTLAGGKIITAIVLPFANRIFSSAGATAMPAGVNGIAPYSPGMQPFRRYAMPGSGVNGIAPYSPGMQPFPAYNSGMVPMA